MSRRSTPSFAVGGVSWLAADGRTGYIGDPTPTGWRCFHCNEHFTDANAAWRHFGNPAEKPGAHPPTGCQQAEVDRIKSAALSFITDVQTRLLSRDENLLAFPLDSLDTLIGLIRPIGTAGHG